MLPVTAPELTGFVGKKYYYYYSSHTFYRLCLEELILAGIQMADLETTMRSPALSCCDADLSVGGRQICKYALLTRINRRYSAVEM